MTSHNLLIFLLLWPVSISTARTLQVGHSYTIKTIRNAIEQAEPCDSIFVQSGVYRERNLVISKSLHLIGEKNTTLDGEDKYEILTLTGNHFSITGITFKNSGYSSMNDFASIKIINASDFSILNNILQDAHFAIHISNSHHFNIANNFIQGSPENEQATGNGIHLWKCHQATIEKNHVQGHRDGIYFEFVTQSNVVNNRSEKNIRYGLHFMFSNNDKYHNNDFSSNGAGVAVMFSHHIIMTNNKFNNNKGSSAYGLLLKEISDGEIYENSFSSNTIGVFMEGTNRVTVKKNKFLNNGFALRIQASCSENIITNNNFISNTFDVTTNGSLVINTFNNNYWDKYNGYDLNRDGIGDVPFHPLSIFAMIIEHTPVASLLLRSFMVNLLDKTEKINAQHYP